MNGPAVPAFSIRFAPPKVEFWGSTWQPVISKFDDNKWGHYAFTLDGKANVTGYYNGEKGITTANKYTFTDNISIGAPFLGKWGQHYNGLMDEVAFFNVALSQADIKGLMAGGVMPSTTAVSPSGKLATGWAHLKAQR